MTLEHGLTTTRRALSDTLHAALASSAKGIGLIDSSKFGLSALLSIARPRSSTRSIVDDGLAAQTSPRRTRLRASTSSSPGATAPLLPSPNHKEGPMARPVTLFTGQWADLPLEELAEKAAGWGFDGLELACWGDHFDVDEALSDPVLRRDAPGDPRPARPRLLRDLDAPRRPGGVRPDRRAAPCDPAARRLGRRRSGRRPPARGREGGRHGPRGGEARRAAW